MLARLYIILFLTCLIPIHMFATPQLILSEDVSSYTNFNVEYLEEKSKRALTIEEVSVSEFDRIQANRFSIGYKRKPVWFRFTIYNDSAKMTETILEMTEMFHRTVDLYATSHNSFKEVKNGLDIPLSEREIKEVNPSFMLSLKPFETKNIYIRVTSTYSIFGSIQLKKPKQFLKDTQTYSHMLIFYFGAILIIALYNLFIFLFLKEKIYLYYVGYVLSFALWVSLYKGLLFYYIDSETFDLLQITVPVLFLMLILFSQAILETKINFPDINRILNGFIWLISFGLIVMLIDLHSGLSFMSLCTLFLMPFLLFTAIYTSSEGYKIAKIYFLVLSISFIGMSLISMLSLGLIPYSILIS